MIQKAILLHFYNSNCNYKNAMISYHLQKYKKQYKFKEIIKESVKILSKSLI